MKNHLSSFLVLFILFFAPIHLEGQLPKPSGPYCVGKQKFLVTNKERPELYTSEKNDFRKIVLDAWYPGNCQGQLAPYMHPEIMKRFLERRKVPDSLDRSLLEGAKTHAHLNSEVDKSIRNAPVLLFSHGASTPMEVYTTIFEHLASNGYFVFAISHTYNTTAAEFPDGTVVPSNWEYFNNRWTDEINTGWEAMMSLVKTDTILEVKRNTVKALFQKGFPATLDMGIWRKDISDALDKIEILNKDSKSPFYKRLNLKQIAGFGHSYGGSAMAHSLLQESRLKAAVNLDGWQFGDEVLGQRFRKPFLYIRGGYPQPDALNAVVYHNAGEKMRQIKIDGTLHPNFGDLPLLTGPDNIFKTGTLNPDRSTKIVNTLLLEFFNATLRKDDGRWKRIEEFFEEVSIEQ